MDIFYQKKTTKNFADAGEALKASLANHRFGVLWEMNFKDKLKEKGLELAQNFKVFEACNPAQAKRVLETHLEAGYFLPCKLVVFEDNDTVYMGMIRPTELIAMINNSDLSAIALEVENELKLAIDEAR